MMRIPATLAVLTALLLAACTSDSNLPEATGKGSIRAINAMPASPDMRFLIEERLIDTVGYTASSTAVRYDNLDYTFNIEIRFAGEVSARRVASRFIDVEADTEYTLLVSGPVAAPTITVWEGPVRTFDEAATVFEVRFAHTAASAGAVDYFFAPAEVTPAPGNEAATLAFGEVAAAADFAAGEYVLTITAAGDPDTVLYVSDPTAFAAGNALLITPFDGIATNNAPVAVRVISAGGATTALPDARYTPSVEFVNASPDLGAVDVYADEALTSPVVTGLGYGEVSAEVSVAAGENVFFFTPAGDTGAVSLEAPLPTFGGTRYRLVTAGLAGSLGALGVVPTRRSLDTEARLSTLSASNNFDVLAVFALAPGQALADAVPVQAVARLEPTGAFALPAGSYELYVTEFGQEEVLAGPFAVDVGIGDIIDMLILDAVDPAVVDVLFLAGGPSP